MVASDCGLSAFRMGDEGQCIRTVTPHVGVQFCFSSYLSIDLGTRNTLLVLARQGHGGERATIVRLTRMSAKWWAVGREAAGFLGPHASNVVAISD